MPPRYFSPRTDAAPVRSTSAGFAQLLDAFSLGSGGRSIREAVLVNDLRGRLHLATEDIPQSLPGPIRQALASHEMTHGLRHIDASDLWLFDLQLVEQPGDAPGWNDPVWLYGTLYGPYPTVGEVVAYQGQLAVTRADLLQGLVEGHDRAVVGSTGRTAGILLPGDTPEATEQGKGLILAFPMLAAELGASDPCNDGVRAQILSDVLAALQADLKANNHPHPLCDTVLPVADREAVIRQYKSDGWVVDGDRAIPADRLPKGALAGMLTSIIGVPDSIVRKIPRESDVDEFVDIAKKTLLALPDWPNRRATALKARVRSTRPPQAQHHVMQPPVQAPVRTPARSADPPQPAPANPPDRWMQDFVDKHASNAKNPPRLTRSTSAPAKSAPKAKKPDWMSDFDDS